MTKIKKLGEFYLKRKFLYNLIFLSILFFCHCFWGNMMYVAYPILAMMIVLDNLENGFSYIIFSIPFCFLNIYISCILILSCGFIFIVKFYIIHFFKEKAKPNLVVLIPIIIFLIYCLLPFGEYNLNTLIRFALFLSLLIVLATILSKPNVFRGHLNVKLISFSILISSLFSLTYFFSPYLYNYFNPPEGSLIFYAANGTLPRFMALFYNTNVLAMFCSVILSLLAYFILRKKSTKMDIILFVAVACIGLLTISKTYILILLIIVAVLLIWKFCCNFKKTLIITLSVAFILAIICLIIYLVFPQAYVKFAEIFIRSFDNCMSFEDFMNMITTDRFDLWVEYGNYIAAHPLALFFGRGLGAPALTKLDQPILSPHNGYLSCIYELGLVGTLLLCVTVAFVLWKALKKDGKKVQWQIFLPILVIGIILMFEDLIFYIFA